MMAVCARDLEQFGADRVTAGLRAQGAALCLALGFVVTHGCAPRGTSLSDVHASAIRDSVSAAVRAALAEVPAGMHITTDYRELQIDPVGPGAAMVTALFETTFADSAGPRFRFGGALSLLWTHEADGWRIRSGHSSAPVPRGG
jgi:hypothetical protein